MLPFSLYLSAWTWLERLGGLGLVLLGLLDNSPFPVPGSMDALTVVLSARQKDWWPYYAAMATAGGILGAYVAYALGMAGEQEALEKRLPRQKAEKFRKAFSRYGFWSIFVPALLPPPIPFSPVPLVAGAMKYSRKKFLIAVGVARSIRYFSLAFLGSIYSEQIFGFLRQYYKAVLWTAIVMAVIGGVAAGLGAWRRRRKHTPRPPGRKKPPAKAA
jgi:membrane protein YqaA with SNARE-associated domain